MDICIILKLLENNNRIVSKIPQMVINNHLDLNYDNDSSVSKKTYKNKELTRWVIINLKLKLTKFDYLIDYYKKNINWYTISQTPYLLTEIFIEKYKKYVIWHFICIYQKLSEYFIDNNKTYVDWIEILQHQQLSEYFIKHNMNNLDLYYITKYQSLSEYFVKKNKKKRGFLLPVDCLTRQKKKKNTPLFPIFSFPSLLFLLSTKKENL